MSQQDLVADTEILYRRVQYGRGHYIVNTDGTVTISPEAFADRERMPSVDRAEIRLNNPALTQIGATDGVLTLITLGVRRIGLSGTNPPVTYRIDVIPDPIMDDPDIPDNDAHAKIRATPAPGNSTFKKLKHALAHLAESSTNMWALKPPDVK
ncbi:MAG: hypothetical protein ACYDAR_05925 [Thermomicrobiales bacterium]